MFFFRILAQCLPALARPRLLVHQVYNAGARSLIIIMLCGLFVGMVLGLQGYDLLARFGSEDALGVAAALGLLKEFGPRGRRAAVRGPCRHRADFRNRFDEGDRPAHRDADDGRRPSCASSSRRVSSAA